MMESTYLDTENPKWYVLFTSPGFENTAVENLKRVVAKNNLEHRVLDIVCPTEIVLEETASGKKKEVERKLMPTYIFIKMIYGNDIWHHITKTRGVKSFVGPGAWPLALPDRDVETWRLERTSVEIAFSVGDTVMILDGALKDTVGEIMEINLDEEKCKVMVEMFGRETTVDVDMHSLRKMAV